MATKILSEEFGASRIVIRERLNPTSNGKAIQHLDPSAAAIVHPALGDGYDQHIDMLRQAEPPMRNLKEAVVPSLAQGQMKAITHPTEYVAKLRQLMLNDREAFVNVLFRLFKADSRESTMMRGRGVGLPVALAQKESLYSRSWSVARKAGSESIA